MNISLFEFIESVELPWDSGKVTTLSNRTTHPIFHCADQLVFDVIVGQDLAIKALEAKS